MKNFLDNPPIYWIIGGFLIVIYYYYLIKYDKSVKNSEKEKIIKNFNDKETKVKNIHIFEEYFEDVPLYNEKKIKPLSEEINNDSDWKKMLNEIQAQSNELNNSNSLNQMLMDNDIDID